MSEEWSDLFDIVRAVATVASVLVSIFTSLIAIVWAAKFNAYQQAVKRDDTYLGWLRGLLAETEELLFPTLIQISELLKGDIHKYPTKRLSTDFVEAAKKGIIDHPCCGSLFVKLAELHHDLIHTNEMLKRNEKEWTELGAALSRPDAQKELELQSRIKNFLQNRGNTLDSVTATKGRLDPLITLIAGQIKHTMTERKSLRWYVTNEWFTDQQTNSKCSCD
jgi:hypothetical protein